MSNKKEVKCSTCSYMDEYFGDCCGPGFGAGAHSKAVKQCVQKVFKFYKPRVTKYVRS